MPRLLKISLYTLLIVLLLFACTQAKNTYYLLHNSIKVHVTGHVQRPDTYFLPFGSRAVDAVQEAGGVAEDGSVDFINLSQKLVDGDIVNVPEK